MKTIVIAEAGINHNGKIDLAKKLILAAKDAGADYVKFQIYKTENLIKIDTKMANYQKKNLGHTMSQYQMLKKFQLNYIDFKNLYEYSKKIKIKFLCSVFDDESLDYLFSLKIFDVKIPSGEINNFLLLKKISRFANKVFLSTGMANLNEIQKAISILQNIKKKNKLYVMHCHTEYPTNLKNVNLLFMPELKKKFKVKVGYSDHTTSSKVAIAAIALGAKVIEKHFTISKKLTGPDHKASVDVNELKRFVKEIRETEILLGKPKKIISRQEISNKFFVRKTIVASRFIKKGEKFTESNLACKRPEGGISPIFWKKVIGKKATKDFKKDQNISL